MNDWDIAGQEDLFGGGSETLDEMMDSLASCGLDAFPTTNFLEIDTNQRIQVVPYALSGLFGQREKEQKKKLKTTSRDGKELSNVVSLKKVTFDIEKFAADECDNTKERCEATARLAVRLGARPSKNKYFNYKQLKEELNVKKNLEVGFDKLSALKSLKKLSIKNKVKKKKLSRR